MTLMDPFLSLSTGGGTGEDIPLYMCTFKEWKEVEKQLNSRKTNLYKNKIVQLF